MPIIRPKCPKIQSKERDLDTLRARNEALEAQIREMQEKYRKELEDLQVNVVPGCTPDPRVSDEHAYSHFSCIAGIKPPQQHIHFMTLS